MEISENNESDSIKQSLDLVTLLIPRLERITPDSSWAHRATGVRRSLLRLTALPTPSLTKLHAIIQEGFQLLEKAAMDRLR